MTASTHSTNGSRRGQLLRHPFFQFTVAGMIGMALITTVSIFASRRAGEAEAITEARQLTQAVAGTVVGPNLTPELLAGDADALAELDRIVTERVILGTTVRVKLWDADGKIIYSDEPRLIGEVYPHGGEKAESLWSGETIAEISSLEGPENRFEADRGQLLEVYLPVVAPDGRRVLYESYFDFSEVSDASNRIRSAFLPIVIGSLAIMQLMHLGLAWALNRRLSRGQRERERLLQRAIDSSDVERRRIAGDLHDGVVQDLVGTSFAISAAAATAATTSPELAKDLRSAAVGTRRSLQSLRSLLVDIYPANLKTQGLEDAIADLLAPAMSLGIETELAVRGDLDLSLESTALIYRVVQESVRNVFRHADAGHLTVSLEGDSHCVSASVVDDGKGFTPPGANGNGSGHMGLRLLSDLTADAGAGLSVESNPGRGTTIHLEVPR